MEMQYATVGYKQPGGGWGNAQPMVRELAEKEEAQYRDFLLNVGSRLRERITCELNGNEAEDNA